MQEGEGEVLVMDPGSAALDLGLLWTKLAEAVVKVEEVKSSAVVKEDKEDGEDGEALKAQA